LRGTVLDVKDRTPMTNDKGVYLYLAKVVRGSGNQLSVAALDRAQAPRADPDDHGSFVFTNVPPGEYAVAVLSLAAMVLAKDSANPDKDLIVTVQEGQTLDLGTIYAKSTQ
jgi:hypothetical protein